MAENLIEKTSLENQVGDFVIDNEENGNARTSEKGVNVAEDLMEKISLEDEVDDVGTDSKENGNTVKNEKDFNKNKELLPSKVTEVDYIYMPPLSEGYEDSLEWKSSGKWLLYTFDDLEKHDMIWTQLQPLLVAGTLSRLKASTANNPVDSIIMCYTSNCEDRKAVKKAADAIRDITGYDRIIYYKTNKASEFGLYRMHGDLRISKYMHTVAHSLYEKDQNNRWIKISSLE